MIHHLKDGDIHRAGDRAMAATHTKIHTETLFIINELMHGPLPPPAVLCRAWIVSACLQGEVNVVAGIITFVTNSRIPDPFIGDLEAMTSRTNERAGITAYAVT